MFPIETELQSILRDYIVRLVQVPGIFDHGPTDGTYRGVGASCYDSPDTGAWALEEGTKGNPRDRDFTS